MKRRAKNKYYKGSHISEVKFRQIIKCFAMDLNAYETAQITNISHVSCKNLFKKIRLYIFNNLLEENFSKGIFELDE
jgi:transposase